MWALAEAKRTKGLDKELAAQTKLGDDDEGSVPARARDEHARSRRRWPSDGRDGEAPRRACRTRTAASRARRSRSRCRAATRSTIETTALATLALIKASPNSEYEPQIRAAVDWLNEQARRLRRVGQHAGDDPRPQGADRVRRARRARCRLGRRDADHQRRARRHDRVREGPQGRARVGRPREQAQARQEHHRARARGGPRCPTRSRSRTARRSPRRRHTRRSTSRRSSRDHVKMGEGVKLRARVENKTAEGLPMTLARIGIPGGLGSRPGSSRSCATRASSTSTRRARARSSSTGARSPRREEGRRPRPPRGDRPAPTKRPPRAPTSTTPPRTRPGPPPRT